jgi:predicted nucleic acid-binding Zn ribbon protein
MLNQEEFAREKSQKYKDKLLDFISKLTTTEAKDYGALFSESLWSGVLEKCGLSQGVSHTKIADLDKTILLIEADHSGWIQLLQTKQKTLMELIQRRFPEITLTGLSFRLGRSDTFSR